MTTNPFGEFGTGDFRCGRCGTLLDGGTDEPVAARDLRQFVDQFLSETAAYEEMPAQELRERVSDFRAAASTRREARGEG